MKRFLLCTVMILALIVPAFAAEYIPGDVLVVLKPSDGSGQVQASAERMQVFAANAGAHVKEVYSSLSESGSGTYALLHSDRASADVLARELLNDPQVLAASPNYIVRTAAVPNDTYMKDLWGMTYIDAPSAWDITTGSSDVYVAIIDTGVDDTNPDLTDNVATQYGANTIYSNSTSARDDDGHGSHVAGIIGAVGNNDRGVVGVCWKVGIISVKALNNEGIGSFANVISALDYVTGLIKQGVNIKAVNMSLETYIAVEPTHDNMVRMPLWRAFKALDELNKAVIVVAAGNHATAIGQPTTRTERSGGSVIFEPGEYVYPPSFTGLDNMISVSAQDTDGKLASFSNTRATMAAPGVDILSTYLQSRWLRTLYYDGTSLIEMDGTSMAAPHVSGAAALIASTNKDLTAWQIKQVLIRGYGDEIEGGKASVLLNVRKSLDYLAEHSSIPSVNSDDISGDNSGEDANAAPGGSENGDSNSDGNGGVDLPDQNPGNEDYNDYQDYTPNEDTGGDNNSGGGSGSGCSGLTLNMCALVLLVMLFTKRAI